MVTNFAIGSVNGLGFASPASVHSPHSMNNGSLHSHPHGLVMMSGAGIQFPSPQAPENAADYTPISYNNTAAQSIAPFQGVGVEEATSAQMAWGSQSQPHQPDISSRRCRLTGAKRKSGLSLDDCGGPSRKVFVDEEKMSAGLQGLQLLQGSGHGEDSGVWFREESSAQPMEATLLDAEVAAAEADVQPPQLEIAQEVWESLNYKSFLQRLNEDEFRKSCLALVPYRPPAEILAAQHKTPQVEETDDRPGSGRTDPSRFLAAAATVATALDEDVMVDFNGNSAPTQNLEAWTVTDEDIEDMDL